jgi:hypothetical protein
LTELADIYGIDLPSGLNRTIVIEELLEALGEPEEGADKNGALAVGGPRQGVTAPLPKFYNITYVEVLIRDPLWAFAFWEVNAHDKELWEKAPDFGGYCLRVSPEPRGAGQKPPAGGSFTVQVGIEDSAWYLGFPPEGGTFKVELCAIRREEPVALTVSRPFTLPSLLENSENGTLASPLLRLSGFDDFMVLHDTARSSRVPKRHGGRPGADAGQ